MADVPFNTGNALGSADPKDRWDNSLTLDYLVNGDAQAYIARLGKRLYSIAWMNQAATGIPAVQASIDAQSARDAILLSNGGIYTDVATGLPATAEGKYFNVLDTDPRGYLILYQKVSGVAVEKKRWPSSAMLAEIQKMIFANGGELGYLVIADPGGGVITRFYDLGLDMPRLALEAADGFAKISDDSGALYFYHDSGRTIAGHAEFGYTGAPGLFVVNEDNYVINDLSQPLAQDSGPAPARANPIEGEILFCRTLVTSEKFKAFIYPQSLIQYRERAESVVATIGGEAAMVSSGKELRVDGAVMGPSAILTLRDIEGQAARKMKQVKLVNVPTLTGSNPITVLMIGDSICNRQGAQFTKQALEAMGYTPSFIGVMKGSANPGNNSDATGPAGEGREGWETGDFTYWETNRVLEVAPGTEAAFLAMSKTSQIRYNGFIRPSTGADDPAVVRNGMVFDFAYYLSRFSFATPDVVTITLGTNDGRDLDASVIRQVFKDNLTIMIKQILAAAPAVKIVLGMPGTAYDSRRYQIWTEEYTQMIAVFGELEAEYPASVSVAPIWAMCDHDSGYSFAQTTTSPDGFADVVYSDAIHPIRENRKQLYTSLAPYIAAAKQNLI